MAAPNPKASSEFQPVASLFLKKNLPKQNVVVGEEISQIQWLEKRLGTPAVRIDRVTDDSLLGKGLILLQVYKDSQLDISQQVKEQAGIWAAMPLTRGSAGWNAIVRSAPSLLGIPVKSLPKDYPQLVTNAIAKTEFRHLPAAIWAAVTELSGPLVEFERWKYPWEDPWAWMPSGVDKKYRLNSLYRDLIGYVYVKTDQKENARKFGVSPSKSKFFESLTLPSVRVGDTIKELSAWRITKGDPMQCALRVSRVWSR